ncbi:MAG: nucleotidyltransferase domain-containing protein [Candidatus Omnitrophica bacterium]|nr:nucleotidyltransferase domain-containing protein [Candidatus Omnitrophota bacterium]
MNVRCDSICFYPIAVNEIINYLVTLLKEAFAKNLKGVILFGSWARGDADSNSDIDLLVILDCIDHSVRRLFEEMRWENNFKKNVNINMTSAKDFQIEKIPLYTAVKKEGIVIFGEVDLSINKKPPSVKYKEFFEECRKFYIERLNIAKMKLKKYIVDDVVELCFNASKCAIQNFFATKEIFTNKTKILLILVKKHLGKEFYEAFKKIIKLHNKCANGVYFLDKKETNFLLKKTMKIMTLYKKLSSNRKV